MRSLSSILSLFFNEINQFNNTETRMLDSIYLMALKVLKNRYGVKTLKILHLLCNVIMDVITLHY